MQTQSEMSNHFRGCPLPFHTFRITTVKLQLQPLPHPVRQSGFREARSDNATFFGKKLYKFKNDGIFHHDILIR